MSVRRHPSEERGENISELESGFAADQQTPVLCARSHRQWFLIKQLTRGSGAALWEHRLWMKHRNPIKHQPSYRCVRLQTTILSPCSGTENELFRCAFGLMRTMKKEIFRWTGCRHCALCSEADVLRDVEQGSLSENTLPSVGTNTSNGSWLWPHTHTR